MFFHKVNELNRLFKDLGLQANPYDRLLEELNKSFAPNCIFTLNIVHADLMADLAVSAMYRLLCIWLQEGLTSILIDCSDHQSIVDDGRAFPCTVQSLYDRGLSIVLSCALLIIRRTLNPKSK